MPVRQVLSRVAVLAALGVSVPVAVAGCASSSASPVASPPAASVNQLLNSAAQTESDADLQYQTYAVAADQSGQPALADVWRTVGEVEHQDHWTHEITLSGLYSGTDNVANVQLAVRQAQQAATADQGWAAQAPPGSAAARELQTIAARETTAANLLSQALNAVQGKGASVPAAPAVQHVSVQASAQPNYSGALYTNLTDASNSALETAAWNWAQYQFQAKTAVDTGQANLAQLLSGLQTQEVQNFTELSNVAGYANPTAMNLQASIASEQGAIDMYQQYAPQAQQAGNPTVANTFRSIMGDEQGHHQTFTTELQQLNTGP